MLDDLSYSEIVERLKDHAEQIASDCIPGGRRSGNSWSGDLSGKCSVHVSGTRVGMVGFWQHQAGNEKGGGNLIHLIELSHGCKTHGEAVKLAKERYLGITKRELTAEEKRQWAKANEASIKKASDRKVQAERADARKIDDVKAIWGASFPIKDTLAERYLRNRGIDLPIWPASLKFHPNLQYQSSEGPLRSFPALVCGVQSVDRKLVAIWQIYLNPLDTQGSKAPVKDGESPKKGRGPASGGAVRLGFVQDHLCVTEGVETALGAMLLTKLKLPFWAALSTSGMRSLDIPEGVKRLDIYADGDRYRQRIDAPKVMEPPGLSAANALKERAEKMGIKVNIMLPPEGSDWLDVWNGSRK